MKSVCKDLLQKLCSVFCPKCVNKQAVCMYVCVCVYVFHAHCAGFCKVFEQAVCFSMFILLGLCEVCEQESCVCMCFHANSARQVALQARWLQLLDMAWTQGALCGARSGPTNSTHSWLWGISFPLEVCGKKVRQYRLSDLSVFCVLGMLE
jgi:hypothetical protein